MASVKVLDSPEVSVDVAGEVFGVCGLSASGRRQGGETRRTVNILPDGGLNVRVGFGSWTRWFGHRGLSRCRSSQSVVQGAM